MFDTLRHDVRAAVRSMRSAPALTAIAVLTLALGVGANTAIFSFVYVILLRPLPYPDSDRLVVLTSNRGGEAGELSLREVRDLQERAKSFNGIAAWRGAQYNSAEGAGRPEELPSVLSTYNLFEVLGVPLGRGTTWAHEQDITRNFDIIISHDLWQRRFNGDPRVLGRKITLDASPSYIIRGVAPQGFEFPRNIDVYRCIGNLVPKDDRGKRGMAAVARLRDGVTIDQARAELQALSARLAREFPATNGGVDLELKPLRELWVGASRPYLWALFGIVAFVLLIACANVVNLQLSRAVEREKEAAIRTSLGASRRDLIRQLLTESAMVGLAGGLLGLGLAFWLVRVLGVLVRAELPPWMEVSLDLAVLGFAFAVALVAGIVSGLAPALQASNPELSTVLKDAARGSTAGGKRVGLRQALVIAELAIAFVLLVGAGLMVQSFARMVRTPLGFNDDRLLTFRIALPWRTYATNDGTNRLFYERLLQRLSAVPGVERAALDTNLPMATAEGQESMTFTLQGQGPAEHQRNPYVNYHAVSADYFTAMQVPIVRGRAITASDRTAGDEVAVISRNMAERVFRGADPIGKRIRIGSPDDETPWMRIVGIAGDVKSQSAAAEPGLDVYASFAQQPDNNAYVILQTRVTPLSLSETAVTSTMAVDRQQSIFDVATMEQRVADAIWQQRLSGFLSAAFAVLALILAAVGIYGVVSYGVRQRTREIGVRMALGAGRRAVVRMVVGETMRLAAAGATIGLGAGVVLAYLLGPLLYGIGLLVQVPTFVTVAAVILSVALFASLIPGRRASRLDPNAALRYE